jgi:hypothetical protein
MNQSLRNFPPILPPFLEMTTQQSLPVGVVGYLWIQSLAYLIRQIQRKTNLLLKKEEEVKCENVNRYNKKL